MKAVPVLLALLGSGALAGCIIGDTSAPPPGGGSGSNPNNETPDAQPSGGGTPDAPPAAVTCTVNADLGNLGPLANTSVQQGNVSGSMGAKHYYKMFASVPGTGGGGGTGGGTGSGSGTGVKDYVMIMLVDDKGPFLGKTVAPGTYTISGADTNLATCGVCVIALGDVDPATNTAKQTYLAQSGSVTVDTVGGPNTVMSASITGAVLKHWDMSSQLVANDTCASNVGTAALSGTVVAVSGPGL